MHPARIGEEMFAWLDARPDLAATPADYNQVIHAKTASLFSAAAEVGPAAVNPALVVAHDYGARELALLEALLAEDRATLSGTERHRRVLSAGGATGLGFHPVPNRGGMTASLRSS